MNAATAATPSSSRLSEDLSRPTLNRIASANFDADGSNNKAQSMLYRPTKLQSLAKSQLTRRAPLYTREHPYPTFLHAHQLSIATLALPIYPPLTITRLVEIALAALQDH